MARRINLVPTTERARTTTNFGMLAFVAAAIIVVGALGLGYYVLNNDLSDKKAALATDQALTEAAIQKVAGLREYADLDAQRKQVEAVVQSAYAGRTLVADILDSFSLVLPDNVWLNTMSMTTMDPGDKASTVTNADNTMNVTGDTYGFEDVAQLLVRLQLMPALANVKLSQAGQPVGTVDETKDVKGFTIGATVNNTQASDAPLPVSQVEVEGL